MRFLALFTAAALTLTAPLAAEAQPATRGHDEAPISGSAAGPSPAPSADKKKDPVICKRQEETGSRLGGKQICMTKSQWDEQRADAQRGLMGAQATPH